VDKVDYICDSGIVCGVYDLPPDLCYRRAAPGLFNGILWDITSFIPYDPVLGFDRCYSHHVSHPRLCLEIVFPQPHLLGTLI
jgi:hypothetical protein